MNSFYKLGALGICDTILVTSPKVDYFNLHFTLKILRFKRLGHATKDPQLVNSRAGIQNQVFLAPERFTTLLCWLHEWPQWLISNEETFRMRIHYSALCEGPENEVRHSGGITTFPGISLGSRSCLVRCPDQWRHLYCEP